MYCKYTHDNLSAAVLTFNSVYNPDTKPLGDFFAVAHLVENAIGRPEIMICLYQHIGIFDDDYLGHTYFRPESFMETKMHELYLKCIEDAFKEVLAHYCN